VWRGQPLRLSLGVGSADESVTQGKFWGALGATPNLQIQPQQQGQKQQQRTRVSAPH
jgi:hypothetical protein